MNAQGGFVLDGQGNRIRREGMPPCQSCPKQAESTPPDQRKPLPMASDFGPWFWELRDWYFAGRAVGFGDDLSPLLREIAGAMLRDERAGERDGMRSAVEMGVRAAFGKR